MSNSLTPITPLDAGWVLAMTPEMAQAAGVNEGSQVIFYFRGGGAVSAEILPPIEESLRSEVHEIAEEFAEAFAEMKRRGD